jgi:predicted outer membrane protein
VLLLLLAMSCQRSERGAEAVTPQSFIVSAYLAAAGDANVCALAARRASLPETRILGAATYRTLVGLRGDLVSAAQRKQIALPASIEEKKLALRDNLSQLPGRVFDQGYALAMVQDTRTMLQLFNAPVDDPVVRDIISKYRAQFVAQQHDAGRLLNELGGAPWPNFSP